MYALIRSLSNTALVVTHLLGDKSGLLTKACISIGNVENPNSVNNQVLVCVFDGNDKGENLRKAFSGSVFKQMNQIKELAFGKQGVVLSKQVEWYVIPVVMPIFKINGLRLQVLHRKSKRVKTGKETESMFFLVI